MTKLRTIYNPGVAMVYLIQNIQSGEVFKASTCGIKDTDCLPWRSPKSIEPGKEFFKMKLGSKSKGFKLITFLNSNRFTKCLSDDGEWEFIGKRPDGGIVPKLVENNKVKKEKPPIKINHKGVKSVIQKIQGNALDITTTQIHATIENEEFVDMSEMQKILK